MREYETVVVFHPDLGEEPLREWIGRVRSVLEGRGARILDVDEWGTRELAYRIAKQRKGAYVMFRYEAEPAAVAEAERQMRLSDQVLRFLSVREPLKLPPSARSAKGKAAAKARSSVEAESPTA